MRILFIILLFTSLAFGQTRYVTVTGAGAHDGTNEANAYTLSEAFAAASAGMTFNVKAGNYGTVQTTFSTSGTTGNPISFIGYKTTPGDIVATSGSTLYTGGAVNTAESPCIVGTITSNRPNQNTGLLIQADYIVFKNFAFQYYNKPIEINGDNNVVDNIYTYKAGNHNPADASSPFSTTFPTGWYLGYGMRFSGNNLTASNLYVLDAGAEGIRLTNAVNPSFDHVTVRCILGVGSYNNLTSGNGNPTDYHFLVGINTNAGNFTDINVINNVGLTKVGHGIAVKPNEGQWATNHLFDGFYVENSKIETQFPDTQFITFRNGEITSTDTDKTSRTQDHDMNIANGSRYVVAEQILFTGGAHVASRGWDETIYPTTYTYAARDFTLRDCLFIGNGEGTAGPAALNISYNFPQYLYTTENWTIDHCTFVGWNVLWDVDKPNTGLVFVNNIVKDVADDYRVRYHDGAGPLAGTSGPYALNISWSTSNFDSGFTAPSGTAITTFATGFADEGAGDYSLDPGSALNDISIETSSFDAGLDLGWLDGNLGGGGDTTPPSITTITVDNITETSFRVDWSLDEGSKGRIYFDTSSHPSSTVGTVATDYPNQTALESNFLTRHIQTPGPGNPSALTQGTQYFWRIFMEDAAVNTAISAEQTTTTLGSGGEPEIPPSLSWQQGLKARFLKRKKGF